MKLYRNIAPLKIAGDMTLRAFCITLAMLAIGRAAYADSEKLSCPGKVVALDIEVGHLRPFPNSLMPERADDPNWKGDDIYRFSSEELSQGITVYCFYDKKTEMRAKKNWNIIDNLVKYQPEKIHRFAFSKDAKICRLTVAHSVSCN